MCFTIFVIMWYLLSSHWIPKESVGVRIFNISILLKLVFIRTAMQSCAGGYNYDSNPKWPWRLFRPHFHFHLSQICVLLLQIHRPNVFCLSSELCPAVWSIKWLFEIESSIQYWYDQIHWIELNTFQFVVCQFETTSLFNLPQWLSSILIWRVLRDTGKIEKLRTKITTKVMHQHENRNQIPVNVTV